MAQIRFSGGSQGGGLTDPEPKFPRSMLDAPIMSIGAPRRPRRCMVFDSLSSGAAERQIFRIRGRSKRTGGMVAGCKTTPPTAPPASENFFNLFLGPDTRPQPSFSPPRPLPPGIDASGPHLPCRGHALFLPQNQNPSRSLWSREWNPEGETP